MPNQLVGLENIPNVYINKITLKDNDLKSYKIVIDLEINDVLENGAYTWSDDNFFTSFFKIGVILTYDKQMSSQLKNGLIDPTPSSIKQSPSFNRATTIKTLPIKNFAMGKEGDLKKFQNSCTYVIQKASPTIILDVYAIPYIDMVAVESYMRISLNEKMRRYFGPLTSEKILEDGTPVTLTTLFIKPNNTAWKGPVHVQNNVYMGGPFHTARAHPILKAVKIPNDKLLDTRTINFRDRQIHFGEEGQIIGDLLYSFNDRIDLTGMFSINMRQLALTKIKNGRKMLGVSNKLFQEFLDQIEIRGITIVKNMVSTIAGVNSRGTPKIEIKKTESYEYLQNSQRIFLNPNPFVHEYQFVDTASTYDDQAQYKYSIQAVVVDKSQEFLNSKSTDIQFALDNLQSLIAVLNTKINYDYTLDKLRPGVTVPSTIPGIITTYYRTTSYFKQIPQEQLRQLTNNKINLFTTGNYKASEALKFLLDLKQLKIQFDGKFNFKKKSSYSFKKVNTQKSFMPGIITLKKEWDPIIIFAEFKRSYNYLGVTSAGGFASITKTQLSQRGDKEVDRLFHRSKSMDTPELNTVSAKTKKSLKDLNKSKDVFLAPLSFDFEGSSSNLTDLSRIDTKDLTTKFLKSRKEAKKIKKSFKMFQKKKGKRNKKAIRKSQRKGRLNKLPTKRSFDSAFKVSKVIAPLKINNLNPLEPTIESSVYLGLNSEFAKDEINYTEPPSQFNKEEILENLEAAMMINTNRNKLNFDLSVNKNDLDVFLNSDASTNAKIKNAPNHFKALIASKSPAAKNGILKSKTDILQDPSTKVATEMTFQVTQKIEMLAGYRKDKSGIEMLNRPIWIKLDPTMITDKNPVVCRMVYNEQPEFGLKPNEDFKIPVQNSTFIISNGDIFTDPAKKQTDSISNVGAGFSKKNELSKYIVFATSNVVVQRPSGVTVPVSSRRPSSPSAPSSPTTSPSRGGY